MPIGLVRQPRRAISFAPIGGAGVTADELKGLMAAVTHNRDRAAYGRLFQYFAPRIVGFMARSGVGATDAEEIAQDTLVAVWRKAELYDPAQAAVSTWVFTIARNLRIDLARRATRARNGVAALGAPETTLVDSAETATLAGEREAKVREALATLSQEQALVLRLSFYSEKPHAEIARELGIPLGTVKSRVRLAMAKIRPSSGDRKVTLHHPYDDTLARYAAGRLGAGPSLVVATHLAGCAECRARVGLFEAAGGALLDEAPAANVRPDLFAAALRRIEQTAPPLPQVRGRLAAGRMSCCRRGAISAAACYWRRLTLALCAGRERHHAEGAAGAANAASHACRHGIYASACRAPSTTISAATSPAIASRPTRRSSISRSSIPTSNASV